MAKCQFSIEYLEVLLETPNSFFVFYGEQTSSMVNSLLQKNPQDKICVLDALTYAGNRKNLASLEDNPNFSFIHGNICDSELVETIINDKGTNVIVHFAAESHVDNSISDPGAFMQTNIMGTFNLLKAAYSLWMEGPNQMKDAFKTARFLHISTTEIEPFTNELEDQTLKETVLRGVAYLHEGLNHKDRTIVEELYTAGALQVCIVSRSMLWSLNLFAYLVIIMDTQYYNGQDHTYDDYPISDILQMIGRANRPLKDTDAKVVLMCLSSKKDFSSIFLCVVLGDPNSHVGKPRQNPMHAGLLYRNLPSDDDRICIGVCTSNRRRKRLSPLSSSSLSLRWEKLWSEDYRQSRMVQQ